MRPFTDLLEVRPRETTGFIHLADIPQPYRDAFWKWIFHQTRPYNPDEPDEQCTYVCDWQRWLGQQE